MAQERYIFASDLHGDLQDPVPVNALLAYTKVWKPKHRIFGGDLFDFRCIRSKANAAERRESLQADFDAGMRFLERWRPTVTILGNHDDRVWRLATEGEGIVADAAKEFIRQIQTKLQLIRCRVLVPYDVHQSFELGEREFIHGFFPGKHAAARHLAEGWDNVSFGHIHAFQEHVGPGKRPRRSASVGALCSLTMDYAKTIGISRRQQHGWEYGIHNNKTGEVTSWPAKKQENGKWLLAKEVVEI